MRATQEHPLALPCALLPDRVAHPPVGGRGDGQRAASARPGRRHKTAQTTSHPSSRVAHDGRGERRDGGRCVGERARAAIHFPRLQLQSLGRGHRVARRAPSRRMTAVPSARVPSPVASPADGPRRAAGRPVGHGGRGHDHRRGDRRARPRLARLPAPGARARPRSDAASPAMAASSGGTAGCALAPNAALILGQRLLADRVAHPPAMGRFERRCGWWAAARWRGISRAATACTPPAPASRAWSSLGRPAPTRRMKANLAVATASPIRPTAVAALSLAADFARW